MTRRYLQSDEVSNAVKCGKSVECFLGACARDGKAGIRWLSLKQRSNTVAVSIFETADLGSEEFTDIGEFGPLDPSLELDEADEVLEFKDVPTCLEALSNRFPGSTSRLVNEGLIQDEYADFISRGRQ